MSRSHTLVVVALLGAFLAACGDSGDVNLSGELKVSGVEFEFLPDAYRVSTGPTQVAFTNAGSVIHEWVVISGTIESEDDFAEDTVLFRLEAEAGSSANGTIDLQPGTYQVICAIEGHFSAGMEGTLVVTGS